MEKILRKYLNLKDTEYTDHAVNAVTEQISDPQRQEIAGVCLLGPIDNSDSTLQMTSDYQVARTTQLTIQ